MALAHAPKVVTNSLLLNLDFKNPKRFSTDLGANNLVQNWYYSASTWVNNFTSTATLLTGIDAPDGSTNAIRFTCNNTGNSLLRVNFNSFTPNGTDTYAMSFWVRKISGTTAVGNALSSDLTDGVSYNYISDLVTNQWVRIVYTGVPTATAKGFLDLLSDKQNDYVLDFWGVKVENITAADNAYPLVTSVSSYTANTYHMQYITMDENSVTFTRSAAVPKHGAAVRIASLTGNLTVSNFLYNDHTWEVWFKINDRIPGSDATVYNDATEAFSTIALYRGYHAGFFYSSSALRYEIWSGITTSNLCASWTLGTSGQQIIQGSWYQAVVTFKSSTGVFTPYLNGVPLGTGSTQNPTVTGISTSNEIFLGGSQVLSSGSGNYLYYGKNSVSNMKMYNRTLTATEIAQNFNALRGRFNI